MNRKKNDWKLKNAFAHEIGLKLRKSPLIALTMENFALTGRAHALVLLRFDFDGSPYNDIYPNIHNNADYAHMQHRYAYRIQHIDSSAVREDDGG